MVSKAPAHVVPACACSSCTPDDGVRGGQYTSFPPPERAFEQMRDTGASCRSPSGRRAAAGSQIKNTTFLGPVSCLETLEAITGTVGQRVSESTEKKTLRGQSMPRGTTVCAPAQQIATSVCLGRHGFGYRHEGLASIHGSHRDSSDVFSQNTTSSCFSHIQQDTAGEQEIPRNECRRVISDKSLEESTGEVSVTPQPNTRIHLARGKGSAPIICRRSELSYVSCFVVREAFVDMAILLHWDRVK